MIPNDEIDGILSSEPAIIPSAVFTASVMDAITRESQIPAPIPFPWKRALPGMFAAGLAFLSVLVLAVMLAIQAPVNQPLPAEMLSAFYALSHTLQAVGASWIALALVLTLFSVMLSTRFVATGARN